VVSIVILLFFPKVNLGQVPDLGAATGFALFTAVGAFDNDGATVVTGDIGTNDGAFSGFLPGIVDGQIHVTDLASSLAATDVDTAYTYLSELTCGPIIGITLGNGQILTKNVYCLGAASNLEGDLILDGEGDPDALFIFKIDGALLTKSLSNVVLTGLASECNVYWQINGSLELGSKSTFKGTALVNGAITLLDSSTLTGRGLSRAGEISLHRNLVSIGQCSDCLAPDVTAIDSVCGNSASLCWSPVPGATGYLLLWREVPDQNWIIETLAASDTCRVFTNHANALDEIQLATLCASGDTMYGQVFTYDNYDNVCLPPPTLTTSNVKSTSANLSWSAIPDADTYKVLYRHNNDKTLVTLSGTSFSATTLQPGTDYKWKVKGRCIYCGKNNSGVFSPYEYFTTPMLLGASRSSISEPKISVYPNPAATSFTVSLDLGYESDQSYVILLYNTIGKAVLTGEGSITEGQLQRDISFNIPDGLYMIKIITPDKYYTRMITIINNR